MYSNESLNLTGQGGPASTTIDLSRGNQFFVRFPQSHGVTIYLYDKPRKILVPFTNEEGFTTFTGGKTPDQAYQVGEIYDLPSDMQQQLGMIVPDQYGFNELGQAINPQYILNLPDASGLEKLYGKSKDPNLERKIGEFLVGNSSGQKGILDSMVAQGAMTQSAVDNIKDNPLQLATYVAALAYGDYSLDDIYRDVKAKELGVNVKSFDPKLTAQQFAQTPDYAVAKNNTQLTPPMNLSFDRKLLTYPMYAIPDEAFQTLVPPVDINSQSFKEEASKIKDAYYDLLLQQLDAKTVQEKAIADDNYRLFKEQIQKKYGIQLADNAEASWGQIQQLTEQGTSRGLTDSGIFNELQDNVLASRRKTDARLRDARVSEEELKRREYYVTKASPDQIKNDLTDDEKIRWGLKPSQETLDFVNNLKTNYPDLTDEQINNIRGTLIDQNGNLRSELYGNLYTNRYNLGQNKQLAQEQTLFDKKTLETEKAYEQYTPSDNPFIRSEGNVNLPGTSPTTTQEPSTDTYKYEAPTSVSQSSSSVQNTPAGPITNWGGIPNQVSSTPTQRDLSDRYGLYNKTVYDLNTGFGFSKPEDFFSSAGVTSFNDVKLKTDYVPKFYRYNDNSTVYNAYNNQGLDYDSYIKSGGKSDFSGIEVRKR
ncbi:hypothetical protein M0R04_06070 [Candidatus Dojkabacteria bacterium]|jgi:hypothetical protein|nr:hypothetical protein [Candidatus Dojkabacteria bacterium]